MFRFNRGRLNQRREKLNCYVSSNTMKKRINEKGTGLVEFAIILPVLLMLVFGIIEFGLLLFNRQIITNASREGARAGIVQSPKLTGPEIQTIVDNYCTNRLVTFGTPVNPVTTVTGAGGGFSSDLTVQVQYTYTFLVLPNFMSGLLGNISVQTVMRHE